MAKCIDFVIELLFNFGKRVLYFKLTMHIERKIKLL